MARIFEIIGGVGVSPIDVIDPATLGINTVILRKPTTAHNLAKISKVFAKLAYPIEGN
jgi:hypothetical protein